MKSEWKFDPSLSFSENRRLQLVALGRAIESKERPREQPVTAPSGEYEDVIAESLASITGLDDLISDPAQRVNDLFESISIWEVYKRLLPNKPHDRYHATRDFNVACPHEEGRRSLSMWLNDAKGLFTCGHTMEGGGKVELYCEIRGIPYDRANFFKIKRLIVWEFRGVNPYATETEDA